MKLDAMSGCRRGAEAFHALRGAPKGFAFGTCRLFKGGRNFQPTRVRPVQNHLLLTEGDSNGKYHQKPVFQKHKHWEGAFYRTGKI